MGEKEMNCLCCGKPIKSSKEQQNRWHRSCVKHFFGTTELPHLDISEKALFCLAEDSVSRGMTVPGVQKKMSLHLTEEKNPRLTFVNYPTGYILKPQTKEYQALPEAEYLVMQMAKLSGIKTVPFALIYMEEINEYAYITKRVDRVKNGGKIEKLGMEDFCQLEYRLTKDKYKGSYERCAKTIQSYSDCPGFDLSELFLRIVFSYVVGNSDMHLKNFSLIETAVRSGKYVLSGAYDMLPVNVILLEDKEQMALSLNGRKRNLRRKDFFAFAEACGLPQKSAEKMMGKIVSMKDQYVSMCHNSYLPSKMKEALEALILQRIDTIEMK